MESDGRQRGEAAWAAVRYEMLLSLQWSSSSCDVCGDSDESGADEWLTGCVLNTAER